jgi:hypothetical protein
MTATAERTPRPPDDPPDLEAAPLEIQPDDEWDPVTGTRWEPVRGTRWEPIRRTE